MSLSPSDESVTVEDAAVTSPAPLRTRTSAFTRFERLLNLRECLAALLRRAPSRQRPTRLALEAMEDRLVPDGRPLPFPAIFVGSGPDQSPIVKAYDAETGDLKFSLTAYESTFAGGVRVGTGDFTGDGIPDVVTAPGPGRAPRIKVFDGNTGDLTSGPLSNFLAYSSSFDGGVHVAAADVNGDGINDVVTGGSRFHWRARARF